MIVLFCLLLISGGHTLAQNDKSPVFPEKRHQELMEEISFLPEDEEEKEEEEPPEPDWDFNWDFNLSNTTTIIIFSILIAALGFLIYRMLGDVNMRKRTREEGDEDQEFIDLEDLEEEKLVATGVSLSLLERAEEAGQFDVAVRLLYIQLLKELQDAGLIQYRRDYSNRDYQNQLLGKEVLTDFREVTIDYERYWYGKYAIEKLGYRLVQRKFNVLSSQIASSSAKVSPHA
ncbi:hypothetical protein SAMN05444359_12676 [Neolewinella agarilytica]|uniref:DUF4129 domain-containing protein n=2 Tax=Neolewinella agarilytica TaxID=478744 RepID=A0A1H9M152_9BACT|nr:hypothetical protein SAMN05444359_12676 [Neolewinella agarilytica]